MTDEERQMITDIHDALFKVPPGSKDKPLIEDVRTVVKAYQRASWATRAVVWALPTLAAIGASVQYFLRLVKEGSGG